MPLPSFLQAMFTPQRMQGPGQMAWQERHKPDFEGTGEISYGDIQDLAWQPSAVTSQSVSGPTTRRLPNPIATTGTGPTATQEMIKAIGDMIPGDDGGGMDSGLSSMTGLEPGGMSSITEIMQGQAGEMSPMGYASPFGDPTADELGIGGGSGSALGPGYMEGPGRTIFDDTGGPASSFGGPTVDELGIGGGSGSALPNMTYYNDYLPLDSGQGDYESPSGWFYGGADADQEGMPARYNRVGRFEKPSSRMPIAQFLKSLFSAGGAVAPSANTPPSASDPMPGLSSTGSDALARHYFRS